MQVGFAEIVLAQSYQDLSDQILQKVMTMLQNTREELVRLLALAGKAGEQGYGVDAEDAVPQMSAEMIVHDRNSVAEGPLSDSAGSLNNQDEVDDLLLRYGL